MQWLSDKQPEKFLPAGNPDSYFTDRLSCNSSIWLICLLQITIKIQISINKGDQRPSVSKLAKYETLLNHILKWVLGDVDVFCSILEDGAVDYLRSNDQEASVREKLYLGLKRI